MTQIMVKVAKKINEASDIVRFELTGIDDSPLPAFAAGAHIDVHIKPGLIRQYSLCNNPSERHRYVIAVLLDPQSRGGSMAMHTELAEGQLLQISAPRNHFPVQPATHTLLFAGGIGITPILSMAEHLNNLQSDFNLHYCSRSVERSAFYSRITASSFAEKVHFYFSSDGVSKRLNITNVLNQAHADTHLYICGPGRFIDALVSTAEQLKWNKERIHVEHFSATIQDNLSDRSFDVQLASTGKIYTVGVNQTVTKVLAANGITVPTSCEQGVCGTCITRILSGTPEHRDQYFTDEEHAENDQFTPCCSRSKSPMLILDI